MKILMTTETFLPRIGGAEIHVDNILKEFSRRGFHVVLVTNEPVGLKENSYKNVSIHRITWRVSNFFKIFISLWNLSNGVDIIHCHYSHRMAAMCGLIGFLKNKSVIVVLHGMGILDPPKGNFRGKISHSFYRWVSLKFSTLIISTSEDLARFAYRFVKKDKIRIISNGFDADLFNPEKNYGLCNLPSYLKSEKKVILTVRRLVPKNGIQYLIQAFPRIVQKCPDAILVLLGDGLLMESLKKEVKLLGVDDKVYFEGFKDSVSVSCYLNRADVVVFPSTAESASLACAEAMAMKKKIVASRVGGLVELLGDDSERGELVQLMDWTDSNYEAPLKISTERSHVLSDKIVDLLNGGKVNLKAEKAYSYAQENLSWNSIADKTVDVYREALV